MEQTIKCQAGVAFNCKKELTSNRMLRLLWKKDKKQLDVCPDCFQYIQLKELKFADIKKTDLMRSGYWEEGARAIDIKSYLEKWIKKIKES